MDGRITAVITFTFTSRDAEELLREEIVRWLEALRELGYDVEISHD